MLKYIQEYRSSGIEDEIRLCRRTRAWLGWSLYKHSPNRGSGCILWEVQCLDGLLELICDYFGLTGAISIMHSRWTEWEMDRCHLVVWSSKVRSCRWVAAPVYRLGYLGCCTSAGACLALWALFCLSSMLMPECRYFRSYEMWLNEKYRKLKMYGSKSFGAV